MFPCGGACIGFWHWMNSNFFVLKRQSFGGTEANAKCICKRSKGNLPNDRHRSLNQSLTFLNIPLYTLTEHRGSSIGCLGRHVGSVGRHVGCPGRHVRSVGRHVRCPGRHVGSVGRHVRSVGRVVGSVGRHVRSVGRHVRSVGRHVSHLE